MSAGGAKRICLTPTRNEAWIIGRFLAAARTWADEIVIADQGSNDGTPEAVRAIPGTHLIRNDSASYDELHRQKLLLDKARTFEGRRILIALDADEALSANFRTSKDWERVERAEPGTVLRFRWVNILPGFERAWIPAQPTAFGLVDDGCPHSGGRIHNPRLPSRPGAPILDLEDVAVLHFQYVVTERMQSKQRWYQAWEHATHKVKGPLDIFRQYNHMHGGWDENELQPLRPDWIAGYDAAGIDFRALSCEAATWWDREVVNLMIQHGPHFFRKIALWDRDWNEVARQIGLAGHDLSDPRNALHKAAHRLLQMTQRHRGALGVRILEKMLRANGW